MRCCPFGQPTLSPAHACQFYNTFENSAMSTIILEVRKIERLDTLIKLGQAYVVLPGGTGTLLELAKIWELKNKGFLKTDKPIILLGGFWKPLVDLVAGDDPDSKRRVKPADEPEQAVKLIIDN